MNKFKFICVAALTAVGTIARADAVVNNIVLPPEQAAVLLRCMYPNIPNLHAKLSAAEAAARKREAERSDHCGVTCYSNVDALNRLRTGTTAATPTPVAIVPVAVSTATVPSVVIPTP